MTKEAQEVYAFPTTSITPESFALSQVPQLLAKCRSGEVYDNGYNLWILCETLSKSGTAPEALGTSQEELENFFIQDLRACIASIRQGSGGTERHIYDLITLRVYFFDQNEQLEEEKKELFEKIGISIEELEGLEHELEVRSAKEELTLCRTQGPSDKFYGLRGGLASGTIALDEIGATQEEIDRYNAIYDHQHPY